MSSQPEDLGSFSLIELFQREAEEQTRLLTAGLLALEHDPGATAELEACMRAAHSLKGAARIVGVEVAVRIAHAMEDAFVAAQRGSQKLHRAAIDQLLAAVDLLQVCAHAAEGEPDPRLAPDRLNAFLAQLAEALAQPPDAAELPISPVHPEPAVPPGVAVAITPPDPAPNVPPPAETAAADAALDAVADGKSGDRMLRVSARHLNRLLALAGESLVESRRLQPFGNALQRLKRIQGEAGSTLDQLRNTLAPHVLDETGQNALSELQQQLAECQLLLRERLAELERFDRRATQLADRLYHEARACRMRPFADGIQAFPRMVRDLGRELGKEVRLEISGDNTPVDRDILEKLDAPLGHLLRNALDHGIETPAQRLAAGKPAQGVIRLEARHSGGMLQIGISDDGAGIALEPLRRTVVARGLSTAETVARMHEAELLAFLFLPGFSLREAVTEISGRGVGLDIVHDMVKQVRGTVRVSTEAGHGTRFLLQLPLTLSVLRALLVEIGGEPYAFPLSYLARTLKLAKSDIALAEGRQHFLLDGQTVGLVMAQQLLESPAAAETGDELAVVVLGEPGHRYGLVVERFLGERELVVQPLDSQLGKVPNILAGALMEDGAPVLIVDVDDLLHAVDKLAAGGRLDKIERGRDGGIKQQRKRILVIDDSLTVRELERKLLGKQGYEVEVAVDGLDGWNAVRTGQFDLVVTDIDMPRMDGIELVRLIKANANLSRLPVLIVSYKDREEDRQRGLDAGADYYLAKGSFHDETLLQAVVDLIGEPVA
jgi:two-component system sensor histidine kinase and response regulator WspE